MNTSIYPWQQSVWHRLCDLHQQHRLPHALLLSGEKGNAKQALIQSFAYKLLCDNDTEFACGKCKSCLLLQADTHPDYLLIEPENKIIKVEQIRYMLAHLSQTAQIGQMKVVVIAPAESMNIAAANALLKCLEEPSKNTLIILLSHSPQRLLPTIRSRCQQLVLAKPDWQTASDYLAVAAQLTDQQQREQLLLLANGNPLLAQHYLEQNALVLQQRVQHLFTDLMAHSLNIVKEVDELMKLSTKAESDKGAWVEFYFRIHQMLVWQLIKQSSCVEITQQWQQPLATFLQQPQCSQRLYQLLDFIQQSIKNLQSTSNPNPQLLLETLLIRWQQALA